MVLHRLVTVCPAAHWQICKELAARYLATDNVNGMLNIPLLDDETNAIVGYVCFRDAWTDDKDKQLATLLQYHAEGHEFAAEREYTLQDSREEILATFCTIVADDDVVLSHLRVHKGAPV